MAATTKGLTAREIRAELRNAWRELDYHGSLCGCCAAREGDDLRTWLARDAMYATDRYRPGEGYDGVSEDMIDGLVSHAVDVALTAAREAITEAVATELAGRLTREKVAA